MFATAVLLTLATKTAVAIPRIIPYNVADSEYRCPVLRRATYSCQTGWGPLAVRSTQGEAHAETQLAGRVRERCGHRRPLLPWRGRPSPGALTRWRPQSRLAAASPGAGRAV